MHLFNLCTLFAIALSTETSIGGSLERHAPEYAAIFLPAVFDLDRVQATSEALIPDDRVVYAIDHAQSRRIALRAFGFLEGDYVGSVPTEKVDEFFDVDSEPLVLVLEYEKDYLGVGIHILDWDEKMLFMDSDPGLWPSCRDRTRVGIGEEAYAERVTKFLNFFIDNKK
ncbi:hypothetical protein CC86DRAFT_403087 [Ophiobolus disseminans]|uniref:Uncharacterized protein n=1 Tax=Ophiobolus disseminans TaxID=1469910 RepID=A0A6A7A970_9PLEO|nr:hypothetical protein CC86DRAFT_403087 [Ophiobolus disseminans]